MARRSSVASAADAETAQTETSNETTENNETGSQETSSETDATVENPQAHEHPESGEGSQAGSATGEETEHGAEEGKSDVGALSAEGEGATTTHIESIQRSGDLSGADGEIPDGSTGTRNPDPELANNLAQNEKAVAREQQEAEDREAGKNRRTARKATNDMESLEELNVELRAAEDEVAKAVARRDELRTEHDRLTDRMAAANATPFGDITANYFAASDAQAKEEADARKKLGALGLGGLLSGRLA